MEWKNKIEDECCADELEEMIIDPELFTEPYLD